MRSTAHLNLIHIVYGGNSGEHMPLCGVTKQEDNHSTGLRYFLLLLKQGANRAFICHLDTYLIQYKTDFWVSVLYISFISVTEPYCSFPLKINNVVLIALIFAYSPVQKEQWVPRLCPVRTRSFIKYPSIKTHCRDCQMNFVIPNTIWRAEG